MRSSTSEKEESQLLTGVVRRVTFRNPQNGYTVLQLAASEEKDPITVVGIAPDVRSGSYVTVQGGFQEHSKFGRQFAATSILESPPPSAEGLEKYLSGGAFKGIGIKTARRIVDELGSDAAAVINQDPMRLARIPGVGLKKAEMITERFKSQEEMEAINRFLVQHRVSPALARKIYERFKGDSLSMLSRDPYVLAREMRGVGFATADGIAMNLGIAPDAPERLRAGLIFTLEKASDEGHCYLPAESLMPRARTLLGVGDEVDLEPHLRELLSQRLLTEWNNGFAIRKISQAEELVADFLKSRIYSEESHKISIESVDRILKDTERELGITFSFEQRDAVRCAAQYPLLAITGGPGCGKTTIIRALTHVFRGSGKELLLAAPTGRAAQRMSQVCGHPACTIHRLLRFDPIKGTFLHGPGDPIRADALIIDETSMVDVLLAKALFAAIPKTTTVILVGDKDQLPSVGPGRVFAEVLSIPEIKTISLSTLFRREEASTINSLAHSINSGIVPDIPEPDGVTKADAYFIVRNDPSEAATTIEKLVGDQIPRKFGIPTEDIVVLTPSNRGPLGTLALNEKLQARINPKEGLDLQQQLTMDQTQFRVGDRVCQRVNNYNIDPSGVFNGDVGVVYAIDTARRSMLVDLWDGRLIRYDAEDLYQLSLAYAVTVHRSQGSEIPCVVLALDDAHYTLLERQLVYTAVTRAKKLLIIVGSRKALTMGCKRAFHSKRLTTIGERVRELLRR